jgi:hypothetical protein
VGERRPHISGRSHHRRTQSRRRRPSVGLPGFVAQQEIGEIILETIEGFASEQANMEFVFDREAALSV